MKDRESTAEAEKKTSLLDRQVVLPFKKSIDIAFKNIRVRFLRSLITTITLVLAVSFLSFVHVSNDLANGFLSSEDDTLRLALIHSGYDITSNDAAVGKNPKQRWIVMLSLLVCFVGIVNAQLMAVTERFREIGTMKCLGALDHFILRLFLLEAAIQGLAGAGLGALAGGCSALVIFIFRFGDRVLLTVSWTQVTGSMVYAAFVGCILSLIGVFYPAIVAARMKPVEAMRAEQSF